MRKYIIAQIIFHLVLIVSTFFVQYPLSLWIAIWGGVQAVANVIFYSVGTIMWVTGSYESRFNFIDIEWTEVMFFFIMLTAFTIGMGTTDSKCVRIKQYQHVIEHDCQSSKMGYTAVGLIYPILFKKGEIVTVTEKYNFFEKIISRDITKTEQTQKQTEKK